MSPEIERKFLVANEGWKTAVIRSVRIRDGLIANNKGHKARVRIANDVATIALKSRRRGPVRTEFEYAIPYSDAEEMLRTMCDSNVLDKVRHFVRADEEIARFCAEHGVTDSDLLIAQVLVPFETRPGETAKDAYERELRAMARNDDQGRKSQEALPDTA